MWSVGGLKLVCMWSEDIHQTVYTRTNYTDWLCVCVCVRMFTLLVTLGQLLWEQLISKPDPFRPSLPPVCFLSSLFPEFLLSLPAPSRKHTHTWPSWTAVQNIIKDSVCVFLWDVLKVIYNNTSIYTTQTEVLGYSSSLLNSGVQSDPLPKVCKIQH